MDKVTIYNLLGTCFKVWSSPVEGFGLCDSSTEEICFEIRLSVIAKVTIVVAQHAFLQYW